MSAFKVGDSVECVSGCVSGTKGLVKGGKYIVSHADVGIEGAFVQVMGDPYQYTKSRFELIVTTPTGATPEPDLKFDGGKPKWTLLLSAKGMLAAVGGVVNVLTFGAKKYKEHSWREVQDNERRYMDALIRHLIEIQTHGLDARDKESGELHIDHVNCNGLFLGELARK